MKYLLNGQETERLEFRILEANDFATWLKLFDEPNVARYLGMAHLPTSEEQCRLWFNIQENRYNNDLGGMNVLMDKETGKFVGQCGLLIQDLDGQKVLEIGYAILPEFWGMGYAPEAAQKCRDFAFQNSFAESLCSIIHIENSNSEQVALKNGMQKIKQTKHKEMPVNVYGITKTEWQEM